MNTSTSAGAIFTNATASTKLLKALSRKRSRLISYMLLTAAFIIFCLVISFYAYIAWLLGRPTIPPLQSNPMEAVGLSYENVQFSSANGEHLVNGWYVPGATDHTVILSHGYGTNREEPWVPMYELLQELNHRQFTVLMFDYGFVEPGRTVTGGVVETQELLGAIEYIHQRGAERIFVWGFSMGAGTALQAGLQTELVDAMILDSTFILDPDTMFFNLKQNASMLPRFPSVSLVSMFLPVFNGYSLNQIPYDTVKSTSYNIPMFLIHGQLDNKAPYETIVQFYDQQQNEATQLWLLPDAHHELIFRTRKEEYLERTMDFLASFIPAEAEEEEWILI
ncbi:alpha/beta hydrolase [Paenibacillus senegalensis]|uniref:alpha/beta hydrolase n=1 Tax=Paenibacillus senegalensis TaxID=1465766 RepID=UPI000287F129|nr:alpha/beta fold hydrolase [Paenibacillus senegalensis]